MIFLTMAVLPCAFRAVVFEVLLLIWAFYRGWPDWNY
jgi:hypothetical protein